MRKRLIIGAGRVGRCLAELWQQNGDQVWAVRRSSVQDNSGIHWLRSDVRQPESFSAWPTQLDTVVYAVSADQRSAEAYEQAYVAGIRNVCIWLGQHVPALQRCFFVSSTAVYPNQDGAWVDECSTAQAHSFSADALLRGEAAVLDACIPATVVRFSGIYAGNSQFLLNQLKQNKAFGIKDQPRYSNRIRVEDAARLLDHLSQLEHPSSYYLGSDCTPADLFEVYTWMAQKSNLPPPPLLDPAEAPASTRGNKRCHNKRILDSGFRFLFPSYREGYADLFQT
ncbi:MAG: NAD-dependent epimerase/dehydratase family protein [Myxococcota bacterium]